MEQISIRNAIRGDQANELQLVLDRGIDVNVPFVSICIISITAHYMTTL